MKNILKNNIVKTVIGLSMLVAIGCQRDISELEEATYPTNGEVFIDTFSARLNFSAYGGSVPSAFDTDNSVKYSGTTSMKFEVPDYGDPNGSYAGGSFYTSMPRDLSGYNALTFYIKASQSASIDVIGFGNDFGQNKYQVSISALSVNTNWKKVIIPIPDPSRLVAEKGMFFVSEGPENNAGYTFWVDEVKFEKLGTIAFQSASILNGTNNSVTSFIGVNHKIDGLLATFNLPNGLNQNVNLTPYYFEFASSNSAVAPVTETGDAKVLSSGTTVITAKMAGNTAKGSLTINSNGSFTAAPTPSVNASKVISIFSDAYTNVPVDYYNGYWAPYQTTGSADFTVNGDHVLNYTNFNFVGIEFTSPTVDASLMSHYHMDVYLPSALQGGASFKVNIVDFGSNGTYGGGDDTNHVTTITAPTLQGQNWVSLNIPFSSMTGLSSRAHLGQIIFEGTNISNFYADNIYFYNDGSIIPSTPTAAAPTPTAAATGVMSIFSDAYTNVSGTDFNPGWGQSTVVSQPSVAGNTTLKYAGLNYQGTQFASPLNVSGYGYIHIDYYTANSSNLNFYLISPGPVEKAYALSVPSGIGANTNGWKSVDIPLTSFSPVVLSNIIQFKVDGNGDIYFDNIYFHN